MTKRTKLDWHRHHWDMVANHVTPRQMEQFLNQSDKLAQQHYQAVHKQVTEKMWSTMMRNVTRWLDNHTFSMRQICEQFLGPQGFIPFFPNMSQARNDRFGYHHQRRYHEWSVGNVTCMKKFWLSTLYVTLHKRNAWPDFVNWARSLVARLPGDHLSCGRCRWDTPAVDMYNEDTCLHCHGHPVDNPFIDLQ